MAKAETVASRKASQLALETLTAALPELLGGSADLTGSNLTNTRHTPPLRIAADGAVVRTAPADGAAGAAAASIGRHINYGVREFGMAAVMNGIALHGGYIPYGGTFLTFSDYSRNAIRMAALMKQRVVHVFTHDSIGLGEDGPTHQSVEHAASLRLIPGLDVWRPCDTAETLVAWAEAIARRDRPSALLLSRQNLPYAPRSGASEAAPRSGASEAAPRSGASESTPRSGDVQAVHAAIAQGAYVLAEPSEVGLKRRAEVVLIATGSEVGLALQAQALLADATNGRIAARVVSMPSTTVFDRQSVATKRAVLPDGVPRVAVEAGVTDGWWKYGCAAVVGLDTYGESAPASVLFPHFGFTAQNLCNTVRKVLGR
jgi:transketolase